MARTIGCTYLLEDLEGKPSMLGFFLLWGEEGCLRVWVYACVLVCVHECVRHWEPGQVLLLCSWVSLMRYQAQTSIHQPH